MYEDHSCPLGCGDTDNLPNIIKCSVHNNRLQSDSLATDCIRYEDVFSKEVLKQKEVTQLYTQLLRIRDEIITSSGNNYAGQCINLQECGVLSILSLCGKNNNNKQDDGYGGRRSGRLV